jgi:tRNA (guanine37-N1)-methyltransferase
MRIDILTIFPDMFRGPFESGIIRRAGEQGIVEVCIHNLRDFTSDRHKSVDDRPFGGGEGMVLKPEPIFLAVESLVGNEVNTETTAIVLLSPQGIVFNQAIADRFAQRARVILICGRYEGVDERVADHLATDEISIGDYVLSGGEIPAMVLVDAITRLQPSALGSETSAERDSFSAGGILDCPHYTRPADFRGLKVPDVLVSGNHAEIARWRRRKALEKTFLRRPEVLSNASLSDDDRLVVEEFKKELHKTEESR